MMKTNVNIGYLVFLSFVAALGGFLFGYDTAVISGTIAQVTALFHLDALQQGWYVGCALIGSIAGVLLAGVLSDRFGRKLTMILSAVLFVRILMSWFCTVLLVVWVLVLSLSSLPYIYRKSPWLNTEAVWSLCINWLSR